MAMSVSTNDTLTQSQWLPPLQVPPEHTVPQAMDATRTFSTTGSAASMPTSAPGMYNYSNPQDLQLEHSQQHQMLHWKHTCHSSVGPFYNLHRPTG